MKNEGTLTREIGSQWNAETDPSRVAHSFLLRVSCHLSSFGLRCLVK